MKGFAIIEQLSSGQTSLSDIARRTGLPKSSAFRILATLSELGIVFRGDHGDAYQLTAKMFEYGAQAIQAFDLVDLAKPEMRLVREQTGESVHLAVRSNAQCVYLYTAESRYSLRMHARLGMSMPLYTTAVGKCLLAWLAPDALDVVLGQIVFRRFTPHTITDPTQLLRDLRQIRDQGFALNLEEHEPDVVGLAVPVFDHYGEPVAAISVSTPLIRHSPEKKAVILQTLADAGKTISAKLGCRVYQAAVSDPPLSLP